MFFFIIDLIIIEGSDVHTKYEGINTRFYHYSLIIGLTEYILHINFAKNESSF